MDNIYDEGGNKDKLSFCNTEKYGDMNAIATIGWLRFVPVDAGLLSKESINYAINCLGEQMRIHEGIIITDETELKYYQVGYK